ncbi:MAG: bacillithiol biosynthesis cysteine-adding enzyme BshC [Ignavibacteriae bacterium]|nr:bacillithiol biosynthesis cysteine-adding enzyme BshC [Ignavibacteriota bacterium]
MVNHSYDYDKLPGYSKLFIDFINNNPFFDIRFPANKKIYENSEYLKTISENYNNRNHIKSIIEKSSESIEFNKIQRQNLDALVESNTLTIVTGQQVGFLGGPLYTPIKILTAINVAEKFKKLYSEFKFVPVFWVEDNDHDNLEASQSVIYNIDYEIVHLSCMEGLSKEDRTCVSERKFNDTIISALEKLTIELPESKNKSKIIDKLKSNYLPGESWNDAFIKLLNSWFAEKGLLFIKASEARKSGIFGKLVGRELEHIGNTHNIIQEVNNKIEKAGYHIQAKAFEINVFLHNEKNRYKINKSIDQPGKYESGSLIFSYDELKFIVEKEPHKFSPAVLLRPVFQDFILPTAVYIGGPSEIGYSTQIKELYEYFDVQMPALFPRHSGSFIDTYIQKFLGKQKLEPIYFTKKFKDIEKDLEHILFDSEVEKVFEKARKQIKDNYDEIMNVTSKIDATLIRTGATACHKSLENLDWLEKKINSAQRKVNQMVYQNYRKASNFFFPKGTMQERMFSALNFMNNIGENEFLNFIDNFTKEEADKHYYLKME